MRLGRIARVGTRRDHGMLVFEISWALSIWVYNLTSSLMFFVVQALKSIHSFYLYFAYHLLFKYHLINNPNKHQHAFHRLRHRRFREQLCARCCSGLEPSAVLCCTYSRFGFIQYSVGRLPRSAVTYTDSCFRLGRSMNQYHHNVNMGCWTFQTTRFKENKHADSIATDSLLRRRRLGLRLRLHRHEVPVHHGTREDPSLPALVHTVQVQPRGPR
jgi:hypothetical protein